MRHRKLRPNAGLTLVEMAVSCLVMALVFGSLATALSSSRTVFERGSRTMSLEQDSGRVLRRVTDALRGADAASLPLVPASPLSSRWIDFQTQQGYDGKAWTWSAPRRIEFDQVAGTLSWIENQGLPAEDATVWASNVPTLLEGETANGADDNGNGLIDEAGFCVTREGDLLVLRLTVEDDALVDGGQSRTTELRISLRK
jgi:Tfp pilus assembly protein PilW